MQEDEEASYKSYSQISNKATLAGKNLDFAVLGAVMGLFVGMFIKKAMVRFGYRKPRVTKITA